jgi:small subunit ribosomal protein S4
MTNIPSYTLRSGDVVGVRERSKSLEVITTSLSGFNGKSEWLEWEGSSMTGKFIGAPEREQIPENIKEQLIVELYSK